MIHDPLIRSIRPTVLLAEDDPDQSEMLSEILDAEGFNVDTAFSGDAALHKLRDHKYDLLILDIRMPGANGQEVLRQFRMGEKGGHTPVVIVSAFATEPEMRKYRLDGADDIFSKPYDIHELLAAVKRLTCLKKGAASCSR